MGAETFMVRAKGQTAAKAFSVACAKARHEHGHGGYTGTIAEKSEFVMIVTSAKTDAAEYAEKLINDGDKRIDDKWGPAGCIQLGKTEFLFFGWTSS